MDAAERFALERRLTIARTVDAMTAGSFGDRFSAEMIEVIVSDGYDRLASKASSTSFLGPLVERFTRDRLRALSRLEDSGDDRPAVLFLCVHNAGRSQMALGWLRHFAGDRVLGFSGGSEPASAINPQAVSAMAEVGIDIAEEFPKPWTDEIVRAVDVVVSMGCGDTCPIYPGKRYVDWALEDPAGQGIEAVRRIRDDVRNHVQELVSELKSARVVGR
jgi:arsenate reductase (thioredoxin)